MTSLLPARYKDKTQLISQRCAVHSLHPFHLSFCSETYLLLHHILITKTNVNYPFDIKKHFGYKSFFIVVSKRMIRTLNNTSNRMMNNSSNRTTNNMNNRMTNNMNNRTINNMNNRMTNNSMTNDIREGHPFRGWG